MADRGFRDIALDFGLALGGQNQLLQRRQELRRSNQREREEQQRGRRTELSEGRRAAAAEDFRNIRNLLASGFTDRAMTTINERLNIGRLLPDFDSSSTDFVKTLIDSGDIKSAVEFLDVADEKAVTAGAITARPERRLTSVAAGATLFDPETEEPVFTAPERGLARARQQVSGTVQVQDEEGTLFNSATSFDPQTGATTQVLTPLAGGTAQPVGTVQLVDTSGLTPEERVAQRGLEAGTARAAVAAIDASKAAFDSLGGIETELATLDEAVALLDEGADTGPILNRLPTFRNAALQLENIQSRLGLNVIQNTTFGSLSEAELRFALDTALPTGLQPLQLKSWITRKQDAQRKLSEHIKQAATFLGTPGNTIPKWLEFQKQAQILGEINTARGGINQRLRFDSQGNQIQ